MPTKTPVVQVNFDFPSTPLDIVQVPVGTVPLPVPPGGIQKIYQPAWIPLNKLAEYGPAPAIVSFTRDGALDQPLEIHFGLDGLATPSLPAFGSPPPDADYVVLGDVAPADSADDYVIAFAPGSKTTALGLLPVNDQVREPIDNIHISLVSHPDYQVGASSSIFVSIADAKTSLPGLDDPDDWTYNGGGSYQHYPGDINHISSETRDSIFQGYFNNQPVPSLRLSVTLDPQNPLASFNPPLTLFVDSDRDPSTGLNWQGWPKGVEYKIDVRTTGSTGPSIAPAGVPTKSPELSYSYTIYDLLHPSVFGGPYGAPSGVVLHTWKVEPQFPGQDTLNVDIPLLLLGGNADVDVAAFAYLPTTFVVNPYFRTDLPYHNGDRAPDYGFYNTGTGKVVVREASHPQISVFKDDTGEVTTISPYSGQRFANPDIKEVRVNRIADQVEITLTFTDLLDVKSWDPNVGFDIVIDSDADLSTGQIPMGGAIPTWGGDVALGWIAGPGGTIAFYHRYDDDFLASRVVFPEQGEFPVNDLRWDIQGNQLKVTFDASLLDSFEVVDTNPYWPISPGDRIVRNPAGEEMLIAVTMTNQTAIHQQFADTAPNSTPVAQRVFSTLTGEVKDPLAFGGDAVEISDNDPTPIPSGNNIIGSRYQIFDEYLVIQAWVDNWVPNNKYFLYNIDMNTDDNILTGRSVPDKDNGIFILGSDHTIEVRGKDDVVSTSHSLVHAEFNAGSGEPEATSHDAWLKLRPPQIVGQHGSPGATGIITVTLPLEELEPVASKIDVTIRTGEGFREAGQVPTVTYYDALSFTIDLPADAHQAPQVSDDRVETSFGTPILIDVLDNDTSGTNLDPASLAIIDQPSHGVASVSDAAISYAPAAGFSGTESFSYRVADSSGVFSQPARVFVTIDPPAISDDDYEDNDTRAQAFDLSQHEGVWLSHIRGEAVQADDDWYAVTVAPDRLELNVDVQFLNAEGDIDLAIYNNNGESVALANSSTDGETIRATLYESGTYYLRVYYGDAGNAYDLRWVTEPVNLAPVAADNQAETVRNTPVIIDVLSNDTDPNDESLRISDFGSGSYGTVELADGGTSGFSGDDKLIYTPAPGFEGIDTFEYEVSDGQNATATATVTVGVAPATARADSYEDNDSIESTSVLGRLNEPDTISDLTIEASDDDWFRFETTSAGGSENEVRVEFSHALGDVDMELYDGAGDRVAISNSTTDDETITLDGRPAGVYYVRIFGFQQATNPSYSLLIDPPVTIANQPPVAEDDAITTDEDTAVSGGVLADNGSGADDDPDGDALSVTEVNGLAANVGSQITLASGALLTVNADGTFSYDPNGQFEALDDGETAGDSFSYTVSDGNGGSDTATVALTIEGVSDPVAPDTHEDNDSPEMATDLAVLAGAVRLDDLTVQSNDDDWFRFETTSAGGSENEVRVEFSHTLGDVDLELRNEADGLVGFSYSSNDDETIALNGQPAGVYYVRVFGYSGATNPSYSLFIDPPVTIANQPPVAQDDAIATYEDTVVAGDVLADNGSGADNDPDGDQLMITEVNGSAANVGSQTTLASGALLTVNTDGTFSYDPNGHFEALDDGETDSDSFTYTVSDGQGGTDTATVSLTIDGVTDVVPNQPPVAEDDAATTHAYSSVIIDVLDNDEGSDGSIAGAPALTEAPDHGMVLLNDDGAFIYTPDPRFVGDDAFEYEIVDNEGASDRATVAVTVEDLPQSPMAADAEGSLLAGDETENVVLGDEGRDRLYGGDGDDILLGGGGFDLLMAGAGDDVLDGGADRDLLYGGPGADIFVLSAADTFDLIKDFDVGEGDRIRIAIPELLTSGGALDGNRLQAIEAFGDLLLQGDTGSGFETLANLDGAGGLELGTILEEALVA